MAEGLKSVSVPQRNGKTEDFELFWPKLEAYANTKGFAEALDQVSFPNEGIEERCYCHRIPLDNRFFFCL